MWNGRFSVFCDPLVRASWAFREFPLVAEEVLKIIIAPLRRRLRPGHFQAAGDGILALARAEAALPTEALLFDRGGLGLWAHMFGITCAMCFSKGMSARDEGDGFLVVHRHARECFTDVPRGCDRVGVAIRAFWIHINETHLHGGEGIFQITVSRVAIVLEPLSLGSPVDVLLGLPDICAPTGEAECFESHGFQADIA